MDSGAVSVVKTALPRAGQPPPEWLYDTLVNDKYPMCWYLWYERERFSAIRELESAS